MENKRAHLEMIQGVINRMASNSFMLKGWSITLVSVLLAFSAKELVLATALVALVPALSFWALDAYYLRQEKLFRKLYEVVVDQLEGENTEVQAFSMNTEPVASKVSHWANLLFAGTVLGLHGSMVLVVIGTAIYIAQ